MKGEIRVIFDGTTGQIQVFAPMNDQRQKDFSINTLLSAINMIVNYQPSAIIKPTMVPPANGNGHAPVTKGN